MGGKQKQDSNRGSITPNSGRNLPNMTVKTPMPPVKPPKSSDSGNSGSGNS
ncbi:MAG: hypothetical protein VB958_10080 [Thalassolituus sp.]|uniref:hypothetical protein n=1 Tax=Thalassolituus sp. TaxID=2030822 RepID=UPI003982AA65